MRNKKSGRNVRLAWHWFWLALLLLFGATWLTWRQEPMPVKDNLTQEFSFWRPIESNPQRRMQSLVYDYTAIRFLKNGTHGWAVGEAGSIIATGDGGKSWVSQTSSTTNWLSSLSLAEDERHGWAVGDRGTIVATADGGMTWNAQTSNTTQWLVSVSFSSDLLHGIAVGNHGAVITTDNGGSSWSMADSAENTWLNSVKLSSDSLHGWAVGAQGIVIASSDGGKTWAARSSGVSGALFGVDFAADNLHGWAVGEHGTVITTRDGGKSWTSQARTTTSLLKAVSFAADAMHGWAAGDDGSIIATRDGGASWSYQSSTTASKLHSLSFAGDALHGWAVGDAGTVIVTTDGGQTWASEASTTNSRLYAINYAGDTLHGWAVGSHGVIVTTDNGGVSWTPQVSGTSSFLYAVAVAADARHGWAVGGGGAVITTVDGGSHWKSRIRATSNRLNSVSFADDALHGWAVGDGGVIIATSDGGASWSVQNSGTTNRLQSVRFSADGQHGWAAGDYGGASSIFATDDGGRNWAPQAVPSKSDLLQIDVGVDARHIWAAGGGGAILATADGGRNWVLQVSNTTARLCSVSFDRDARRGWVVGDYGSIMATVDGGRNWIALENTTEAWLFAIKFAADTLHGVAVGNRGTIISTTDGGKSWSDAQHYARYPAPWYGLAILLATYLLWLTWARRMRHNSEESIADMAASDSEVRHVDDDRLEFRGLARGISRFLRNTETNPPLTLAITGDWGCGKSSLMQLVCLDLQRFGHRPIWFNAWHHQKQEQLFAALLGAVHMQSVPSFMSRPLAAASFRIQLLWLRSKKNFLVMIALLILLTVLIKTGFAGGSGGWLAGVGNILEQLQHLTNQQKNLPPLSGSQVAAIAAQVGAIGTAAVALIKGTKVFGVNPAVLLTGLRENLSVKSATMQNDFRAQFAREFGEMASALPYRMVIVVDDLDRCHPSAVLEVMEAVNYLTAAGECFVLFGMASERVQAALGLAFKDIAAEMMEMTPHNESEVQVKEGHSDGVGGGSDSALAKRRAYAADYLQKLVNIEIKVPVNPTLLADHLLIVPEASPRSRLLTDLSDLWQLWPFAVAMVAIVIGAWIPIANQRGEPASLDMPVTMAATAASAPLSPDKPKAVAVVKSESPVEYLPAGELVRPGEAPDPWAPFKWLMVGATPFLLGGAFIVGRMLRSSVLHTKDSREFGEALRIWIGVAGIHRSTPRAIKRFGNRIRYLAMLQQGETKDETPLDIVVAIVAARLRSWSSAGKEQAQAGLPVAAGALMEYQLIAMGAIFEVAGADWKQRLTPGEERQDAASALIRAAIVSHQEKFHVHWPPSEEEQMIFDRLLSGVRLPGDPVLAEPRSDAGDAA